MEGMKTLCTIVLAVLVLIGLYGVWMANFGMGAAVGSTESSLSIIAAVIAVWGMHASGHGCGMKK